MGAESGFSWKGKPRINTDRHGYGGQQRTKRQPPQGGTPNPNKKPASGARRLA